MKYLSCFKGPAKLRLSLEAGKPILLVARNSGPGGSNSRVLAADEAYKAAVGLLDMTGIDLLPFMPSKQRIKEELKEARTITTIGTDGKKFTNEYWVYHNTEANLILFVSTGSGKKLSDKLAQPFIEALTSTVLLHSPALLFSNRLDRIFRRMLTASNLLLALESVDAMLGDASGNIKEVDEMGAFFTLLQSMGSQKEAEAIPKKTRQGMTDRTESAMKNGQCLYGAPIIPPAGLTRIRLKNALGGIGAGLLVIDHWGSFPALLTINSGLTSRSLDKNAKSNAELVQWALHNLGKPGFTVSNVGAYLASEGFSTAGLRKMRGIEAVYMPTTDPSRAFLPVRSILTNLDFYESGVMKIAFGIAGVPDIEIRNCFPASGKWAEKEDFARLRNYISMRNGGGPASLPLVGIQVNSNQGAAKLAAATDEFSKFEPGYVVKKLKNNPDPGRLHFTNIPHSVMANSIIEGLIEASKTTWIPRDSDLEEFNPELRAQIDESERKIEKFQEAAAGLLKQVSERDDSGDLVLGAEMRKGLSNMYDEITTDSLEPEQSILRELSTRLFMEMEKFSSKEETVPDDLLSHLVASLKDGKDTTYNKWWKSAVVINSIDRVRVLRDGHSLYNLHWEGTICISSLTRVFEIPFQGEFEYGVATKVDQRTLEVIAQMAEGKLFGDIEIPQMREIKSSVAHALGLRSGTFNLSNTLDPRLLKIGTYIASNRGTSNKAIAATLNEPIGLIARVRESITNTPFGSRWVKQPSLVRGKWYALALQNDGVVSKSILDQHGSYDWTQEKSTLRRYKNGKVDWQVIDEDSVQLQACPFCGSRKRAPSRIFEPVGLICMACRKDEIGIIWPSDPYDQWLEIDLAISNA